MRVASGIDLPLVVDVDGEVSPAGDQRLGLSLSLYLCALGTALSEAGRWVELALALLGWRILVYFYFGGYADLLAIATAWKGFQFQKQAKCG